MSVEELIRDEVVAARVSGCAVCGKSFMITDIEGFTWCEQCCLDYCDEHYPNHICYPMEVEA